MESSSCCLLKPSATFAMSHVSHRLLPANDECTREYEGRPIPGRRSPKGHTTQMVGEPISDTVLNMFSFDSCVFLFMCDFTDAIIQQEAKHGST